ncbi:glycoside hydrolase domain-containing protein [Roseisolibacter sp. H3M3-2]|uniref:glycoside hydrolase domain-containing protein n=1 Tax=Roseisolibacter sp. H3M3-2 TaxID=3031323 RepID=UPI0023DC3F0F|nr:glycoside hydrolase domain-containing protein [Roseisolibacter sp. H3M3-2]MDF1504916.1 DUF1906 domain-containing protein [Roseisolibacter sp. H3M3-2]
MTHSALLARRLLRRARASWLCAAAAAVVATPWVLRSGVGVLASIETTGPGAAVAAAYDEAATRADLLQLASNDGAAGRHLGFDTSVYPGDRTMRTWKDAGVYEWVGYYLPAPCHRDPSWSGKRATLTAMGWGLAVVYVGQQTWDRVPKPASPAARLAERAGKRCDTHFVSGPRGVTEAADAISRTIAEGFARGTVVYLDIERMERMPQAMRDYYRAWTRALLADGRYVPGVYVHAHNADAVYRDLVAEYRAAGVDAEPPMWVASGRGFHRGASPTDVGHAFAGVWQGVLDVVEHHGGVSLPIDVNVASVPSPSDQYASLYAQTETVAAD